MSDSWVASFTGSSLDLVEPGEASVADADSCRAIFAGYLYEGAALVADPADAALRAYLARGASSLAELRGAFALIIFDPRADLLLCIRDAFGVQPLFNADSRSAVLVSSSVDALLGQPGVSAAVNRPALADRLLYRWPEPTETYFEAVQRVPAGHTLRLQGGVHRVDRYWDPVPPGGPVQWTREDELGRFEELLEQAVNRCLAHGSAGVFLSGGLDSVSVAAIAAGSSRPLALSLVFPDADVNEERIQRRVASDLKLDQVLLDWDEATGGGGLFAGALGLTGRLHHPLTNFWAPAYDRLGAAGRSHGCDVILTGTGGDEWLGVSPLYAADLMRCVDIPGLYRLWWSQRRSYPLSELHFLRNLLWRFGARPLLVETAARFVPEAVYRRRRRRATESIPPWVAPDPDLRAQLLQRALCCVEHPARQAAESASRGRRYPRAYLRELRRPLDHPLIAMEMEETFEQGRRLGLKVLAPFWDTDLLDLLYRTPPELLNTGLRAKGLLREMLFERFPHLGFERQKKVVATRFSTSLLLAEGPRAWRSMGGLTALAEAGIVDAKAGVGVVERAFTNTANPRDVYTGWDVLNSECWLRTRL